MNSLLKFQENLKDKITKGRVNFQKSPKERITLGYVETRIEMLESQWQSFNDTHRQLFEYSNCNEFLNSSYCKNDLYDIVEEVCINYKAELRDTLYKLQDSVKPTNVNSKASVTQCNVQLPKIAIPSFSGKYTEWTGFRDLFVSLIHNNPNLDDVQKLHYLKSHLAGEAEQLLRHIPITEKNYDICWTQLKTRYDNKRFLSSNVLNRLMSPNVLQSESSSSIKELLDTMNECLGALSNLGIDITNWDIIIIHIISQKLDPESRKQWESKANEKEDLPSLETFREFLEHKFKSLEFLDSKQKSKERNVHCLVNSKNSDKPLVSNLTCPACKGNHKLLNCKQFAKQDVESRRSFVQANRLCFNCLGVNHSVYYCRQSSRCQICQRKHHSLLHPKEVTPLTENTVSVNEQVVASTSSDTTTGSQAEVAKAVTCFSNLRGQVLLATAIVEVESRTGINATVRCLLDQGSQASFITEATVQALGLNKVPNKIFISGVGSERGDSLASNYMVFVKLTSLLDPKYSVVVKAHVLNKLTTLIPTKKVVVQLRSELKTLKFADPKFGTPNKVDLLLGAEVYGQIVLEGLVKGPPGSPVAQNTKLGWILFGQIHSESTEDSELRHSNARIISMHVQCNENELLKKFWELENDNSKLNENWRLTEEELRCEEIFVNTTTRDESGRYIVKLPFRDDNQICKNGKFKEIASRRLQYLERRLGKNPELQERYTDVMKEYIELDHMELVPEEQRDRADVVYLPHHAVVKEERTTTKVRVVYDASCPGVNGVSLNDELLVGPRLQPDLRNIVMRWRQHPICLVADIVKMYRQVKVTERDADEFQRILWRDEVGIIQPYRMLRITFGTASAPYLAVRALQQLAYDEGENLKIAAERVLKDFYMDDLMSGCQTVDEGLKVYREINEMMSRGGFQLQKWGSNSKELLDKIGEGKREKLEIKLEKGTEAIQKVLGLTWNNITDEFQYTVRLPPLSTPVTKRKVISDISRLFDPLGWISPVIITAKIFIQRLWMSGIDWDQELPTKLLQDWMTYRDDLSELTSFRIPRWIYIKDDNVYVELQGFSDASNNAYAAVVYVRVIDSKGEVHVNLVTSKTKVSPIKQVSIPRLELCGAQLLAKLLLDVSEILKVPKERVHAWTDSSVVLAWLSSHPSRWKPFVGNRVSDILTMLDRSQWSHVRSEINPADCASRGVKPSDCSSLELWKEGPTWLRKKIINYSPHTVDYNQDTNLEERTTKMSCATVSNNYEDEMFSRFSSLRKLIRVVAMCRRFYVLTLSLAEIKRGISQVKPNFPTWLTNMELQKALNICIKNCQGLYFKDDLEGLTKRGTVNKKSKLASLNPFIDNDGMLRVGGRLQKSDVTESMKHPILIPRSSYLSNLIVAEAHGKTLHGGPQLMLNYIRSRYWIVNAKNLTKMYVRKCVVCLRHANKTYHPIMGQLPSSRVTVSRPFLQSGVDYAGPITIRTTKGRGHRSSKGYICLFVCMATRAVHLEAVSDLTSEGFLAAFKRFVARRGHCADIWSDNGSNFVGAERELRKLLAEERSSVAIEIAAWLSSNGTNWHKIPPYSPNFGGLWEAGIKSTKHHLKRVIGNSTLTFEEITTVLSQIEACLNSRPLSRINENSQDPYPLTPGHFLVGEPLLLVPDTNYEKSNMSSLRRWQLTQKMVQDFWRRWSQEYLTQFLHRYRWNQQTDEPKIGDVVLVKEDDLPPARWLYGIIVDKHAGTDKVTRVVSLRCKGSIIKRCVSKICVLPVTQ